MQLTNAKKSENLAISNPAGPVWRLLAVGETIKKGDEYYNAPAEAWKPVFPLEIGKPADSWPIRRRFDNGRTREAILFTGFAFAALSFAHPAFALLAVSCLSAFLGSFLNP